ncbi:MAG: cell division protein ZapA [Desulfuromonadales bacterium]|nr:cell division protein ZapA [Desulfuromonadales bacterium]
MKESIPVTIFGQSFILRTDSSADEVHRVADFVNQAIDEVVTTNRVADSLNVALLALLNVAQAYLQLQSARNRDEQDLVGRMDRLTQRIEDVLEHASQIK